MNDSNSPSVNLLENPTFWTKVKFQVPGEGVDVWREMEIEAEFEVIDEVELDDMPATISPRDLLRRVLKNVRGLPEGKLKDGTVLSPRDVAIWNQFASDALHATYRMRTTKNGRDITTAEAMKTATTKGNSSRSRQR